MKDSFGVTIRSTDTVIINSYGDGARLVDCGIKSPVVSFGTRRVNIIDADGFTRAVSPNNLGVARRDGAQGYEGNRQAD